METERLIIRRWTLDDAESLFEYAKDPDVGPVAGWPVHKSIEDSISIITVSYTHLTLPTICSV